MAEDSGTYVHDPTTFRDDETLLEDEGPPGEADAPTESSAVTTERPDAVGGGGDRTEREFGWRGWVLLGVLAVAFLLSPALIVLRPPQLPFEVAFLVLPLLPAVLLGATAVWATTRP